MEYTNIKIFLIGKTEAQHDGVRQWLEHLGVDDVDYFNPDNDVCSSPELVSALAAKRCYNSFEPGLNPNVTKVRRDWTEYVDNILSSGHGSVLEHSVFNFAIEGLSRVCTAELNRHHAGVAISEASQRYIRFDEEIPFYNWALDIPDEQATESTQIEMELLIKEIEKTYSALLDLWDYKNIASFEQKKKLTSLFRRIIPQGCATGGVWSFNLRALRHIIALRSTPHAEAEIAYLATELGKIMVQECPKVFGDFEMENGYWVPQYKKV